jgi:hypothetical protein
VTYAEGGKGQGVVAAESAAAAVAVAARMCIPFCIPVPDWPHFPESDHKYTPSKMLQSTSLVSYLSTQLRYHST